jgi:hypothetical protein
MLYELILTFVPCFKYLRSFRSRSFEKHGRYSEVNFQTSILSHRTVVSGKYKTGFISVMGRYTDSIVVNDSVKCNYKHCLSLYYLKALFLFQLIPLYV